MNENYFDNLSDGELRQELIKYGIPVVPIVETTRNLLIKKLKYHILNNATISNRRNRRSLQTSISPRKRDVSNGMRRTHSVSLANAASKTSYTSEMESDLQPNDDKLHYLSLCKDYGNNTEKMGEGNGPTQNVKPSPKIFIPPPILVHDVQRPPKRIESQRTRKLERTSLRNGSGSCGVVSRLLKLRDISIRGTSASSYQTKNRLYSSDSDSDSNSPTRYSKAKKCSRTVSELIWNTLNIKGKWKQSAVPYILICCLGLFFVLLSILYLTKPPDMPSTMLQKSTSFTSCEEYQQIYSLARPSIECINNELVAESLALCKELIQLLQSNTEMHYCMDREVSAEVSASEFLKYVYKRYNSDGHRLLKGFHAAMYLIEQNPQWKIHTLSKVKRSELIDIYKQDIRFILLKPYLPLKCILYNKFQRFLFIIGTTFIIAFILTTVFIIWRLVNQKNMTKLKIVDNFCNEICKELLERISDKNDGGDVIINHLRDKLLPLNKKKSLSWAWNEALRKLESSDSRIQFGTILKNGEEFRTMKWCESILPTCSPSPPNEKYDSIPQKKHWQSPAFDNVNKILEPPTNCLKIRHMFDVSESSHPNLKQCVTESIMEKVGPQCHIYDILLDRQNCCVYIRCASEKDAGIIHNEINGWWFDNRLVSIKFLRLQRFIDRFPNSTSTTTLTNKNVK